MYKIYVLSSKESQLPYDVENVINDKSKEIIWKFIGEVDDIDVAREMVIHDKIYLKKNNKDYWLKHEPCADMKYTFAKIEFDDSYEYYHNEYYDVYHHTTDSIFKRRY